MVVNSLTTTETHHACLWCEDDYLVERGQLLEQIVYARPLLKTPACGQLEAAEEIHKTLKLKKRGPMFLRIY